VGDQTANKDVITQKFTGGQIAWNQAKNTFTTQPANLASALSGLQVPGQKMPAGSAAPGARRLLDWRRWWLPVGVPAVALIGLAALGPWMLRRRRAARRKAKAAGGNEAGYEAVTASVSRWSPDVDGGLDSSTLSDDYRAPRPRTVRLPSQPPGDWMPTERADLVDEPRVDQIGGSAEFSDLDEDLVEHLDERFDEPFDEDPDAVDTAPTRILTPAELRSGRHAAADAEIETTHFAAATPIAPGQLAIHLPMDDPYQVPDGYPVKANASFGVYYTPESKLYEDTLAEIWFATEEIAQANGFVKAD
jgi:uncharacterized protein with LGFP repeats